MVLAPPLITVWYYFLHWNKLHSQWILPVPRHEDVIRKKSNRQMCMKTWSSKACPTLFIRNQCPTYQEREINISSPWWPKNQIYFLIIHIRCYLYLIDIYNIGNIKNRNRNINITKTKTNLWTMQRKNCNLQTNWLKPLQSNT